MWINLKKTKYINIKTSSPLCQKDQFILKTVECLAILTTIYTSLKLRNTFGVMSLLSHWLKSNWIVLKIKTIKLNSSLTKTISRRDNLWEYSPKVELLKI